MLNKHVRLASFGGGIKGRNWSEYKEEKFTFPQQEFNNPLNAFWCPHQNLHRRRFYQRYKLIFQTFTLALQSPTLCFGAADILIKLANFVQSYCSPITLLARVCILVTVYRMWTILQSKMRRGINRKLATFLKCSGMATFFWGWANDNQG